MVLDTIIVDGYEVNYSELFSIEGIGTYYKVEFEHGHADLKIKDGQLHVDYTFIDEDMRGVGMARVLYAAISYFYVVNKMDTPINRIFINEKAERAAIREIMEGRLPLTSWDEEYILRSYKTQR